MAKARRTAKVSKSPIEVSDIASIKPIKTNISDEKMWELAQKVQVIIDRDSSNASSTSGQAQPAAS